MAEQQENKDWLDKLGEFFSKIFINPNKDIAYSIRKRGDDEIEIRDSIFDGYARGFIRFVLIGYFTSLSNSSRRWRSLISFCVARRSLNQPCF